ncbi:MAG: SseB family protein [Butyrivibrio sp.]|nr:SseB family protein [Butyrivibrio sp.]
MGIFDLFGGKKNAEEEAVKAAELEQKQKEQAVEEQKKAHEGMEWPKLPKLNPVNVEKVEPITIEDELSDERKNELGEMVFEAEINAESIRFLSMQEILFLLTTMEQFNKKAPLTNYEANHRKLYNEVLNRVRDAKVLYVLYDGTTGYPFIDHGYINIYLEKEKSEKAAQLFAQQYRKLIVRECPVENEAQDAADRRGFFDYLYYLGIEHIIIDNGYYRAHFKRNEIVAAPGDWGGDNKKQPPVNPGLSFAMLDFLEEVRWPVNYEKRKEVLRAKEMRMAAMAQASKFIVPMQHQGPAEVTEDGKMKLGSDVKLRFPLIKTANEKNFLPVFTDGIEFSKKFKGSEWEGGVFTFFDILRFLADKDGIVINPFGQNIIMPKDRMQALAAAAAAAAAAKKARAGKKPAAKVVPINPQVAEENHQMTDTIDQTPGTDDIDIPDMDEAPIVETPDKTEE